MRHFLDKVYLAAGWTAAVIILLIALLVSAQVLLNFATRVFGLPLPSTIPSYADFSGFMLAAATFLAMPYTLRAGRHIRVHLITSRLSSSAQFVIEAIVLVFAACLVGYACYYIVLLIHESWIFNDVSTGIIPVPLWIPQIPMLLGMGLLLVALIDTLFQTLSKKAPVIGASEEV